MTSMHCGQRMTWIRDTPILFALKCSVCKKVFTQKKRLPKPKEVKPDPAQRNPAWPGGPYAD